MQRCAAATHYVICMITLQAQIIVILYACEIDPEMASEVAKMADIAAMQLAWRETLISTLKHEQLHSASSVASSLVLKI